MRKISYVIILIGLAIFLFPIGNEMYVSYMQDNMLSKWEGANREFRNSDTGEKTTIDLKHQSNNSVKEQEKERVVKERRKTQEDSVDISEDKNIIIIDAIDLRLPIIEGTTEDNLNISVTHLENSGGIGEIGNYVIFGHRSYTYGEHFNRLNELENGDIIKIQSKGKVYKYKIYDKFVVKPDGVWVLNESKEESIVTLITCHPIRVASHRLIVRGKLM